MRVTAALEGQSARSGGVVCPSPRPCLVASLGHVRSGLRAASLTLAMALLLACGGTQTATTSPSPGASASPGISPSPSATSSPVVTPSPTLPAGFTCADASGGSDTVGSTVTAVRTGAHPEGSYDRFTVEFDGAVPGYTVTRQNGTTFTNSPKGDQVTLAGDHGVVVKINPAQNWTSDTGPTSFGATGQYLRQAVLLENFEAVFQWGLGVQGNACLHVFTLTGPSRLVVDITAEP